MARSDNGSSGAEPPHSDIEDKSKTISININVPRRKLTLIAITSLLNILLWSSVICIATSVYQVASDPRDITNIAPVVMTMTSVGILDHFLDR